VAIVGLTVGVAAVVAPDTAGELAPPDDRAAEVGALLAVHALRTATRTAASAVETAVDLAIELALAAKSAREIISSTIPHRLQTCVSVECSARC
jgi:hypothetical protein